LAISGDFFMATDTWITTEEPTMSRYVLESVAPSVAITRTDELRSTPRLTRRAAPGPVKHR